VSIICFYESYILNDYTEEVPTTIEEIRETVKREEKVQAINLVVQYEQPKEVVVEEQTDEISEDDYLLAKIAMAEAEGESLEGKALVIMVVLNRLEDKYFPNTVEEIIFQHNGDIYQFSPIADGRFYKVEPNDECWEALAMVKSGWDESQGALYFEACKGETWHSRNLELLFEEGRHQFYK
jgi:N-acetylmuramoyl-L-alanine amidase